MSLSENNSKDTEDIQEVKEKSIKEEIEAKNINKNEREARIQNKEELNKRVFEKYGILIEDINRNTKSNNNLREEEI